MLLAVLAYGVGAAFAFCPVACALGWRGAVLPAVIVAGVLATASIMDGKVWASMVLADGWGVGHAFHLLPVFAPMTGFEPVAVRLTAECSAIELHRIGPLCLSSRGS